MRSYSSVAVRLLILATLFTSYVSAHIVISYPGWRGNNLHTNGTVEETNGLAVGEASNGSSLVHPYGMQWEYPCKLNGCCCQRPDAELMLRPNVPQKLIHFFRPGGGMPTSENRTKWPVGGGALALQPGWFPGHSSAFFYVNMGFGEVPQNMSFNMVPVFQLIGPTRDPYPGSFCLPQVPLPENATVKEGDKATIQVIETALHGAALYNVSYLRLVAYAKLAKANH